jgi:hypothetical protein
MHEDDRPERLARWLVPDDWWLVLGKQIGAVGGGWCDSFLCFITDY